MNSTPPYNEYIFKIYLYDYLKKRGLFSTAEVFKTEAQVITQSPPDLFNQHRHGFLHEFWVYLQDDIFNPILQKKPPPSNQDQNVGTKRDTTPQLFQEKYSLQHLETFPSIAPLSSCDFSSDGNVLASGGFGKKAFICYMDICECINTSESHVAPISEVRFQQGTTIFASSSYDKTVKLWDSNKPGKVLCDLVGHNGVVKSLDFHPTQTLLCSSDTFDVVEVWDLIQCVRKNNFMAGGQKIRFQPVTGQCLAVANENVITILDIQNWHVRNRFHGHDKVIRSICWDAEGQLIASVTEDCARVWSTAMCGQYIHEYQSNGKRFQSIIFHPKYPNVLVIGGFQNIVLWIPETKQVYSIPAHTNAAITGLAACKQNEFIASCSGDSTVKIWKC